jgi:DNA-binding transcriptional regulator YdaS (Cro superfamily)
MDEICKQAIEVAGGPAKLAKVLGGITSQAISQWKKIPPHRVIAIEAASGISRHRLRPDIYGPAPEAAE